MRLVLLYLLTLLSFVCCWPPIPPPSPPQVGVDRPGSDFGKMPITLPSADYKLCEQKCQQAAGCRAWSYGVPGCDEYKSPVCWLKFYVGDATSNKCRISGILNTRPCQMETQWTQLVDPQKTLPEYPRPQMVRDLGWKNLNGLWEFQPANESDKNSPPFGKNLSGQILVPFPVESCLSGVGRNHQYLWYRLVFNAPFSANRTLLHFGAVDWQTTVWLNKRNLGTHTGGYDGFSFDISSNLQPTNNELLLFVYDPSDYGQQPFGKQRISAIAEPGGDTYSPSSGIWQTVWLENVPNDFIASLKITPDTTGVNVLVTGTNGQVSLVALDGNTVVAKGQGGLNTNIRLNIPSPKLWSSSSPFLYNLQVKLSSGDIVTSYFGLRTITLGKDKSGVTRPLLNGQFIFFGGWLDQSFWPDGLYTAPTDEALAFDLQAVKTFGFNFVRLHQKVNSERWYWYADKLGIVVQQDMVQHYGDAHGVVPDPTLYMNDLKAMIDGRYNHPCIVMWTAFNEGDMVSHFQPATVVQWIKQYDPSRLVDTDSGGPANDLHVGDANDVHSYPDPADPKPSATQFAEVGEFGGLGAFVDQHQWAQDRCYAYRPVATPNDEAAEYITMTETILKNKHDISISVYTQITDVEQECDGFYNYDRTNKFDAATTQKVKAANQQLING